MRWRERQVLEGVREEHIVDKVYNNETNRSVVQSVNIISTYTIQTSRTISLAKQNTLQCNGGVSSTDKIEDNKFFLLNSHTKVLKRQLEEAILLDWDQARWCSV